MTDAELVPLAAAGDVDAFEHLFATYHPIACSLAKRYGAGEHAEDVAQLVLMWLAAGRWRIDHAVTAGDGTLRAFVATITRYAYLKMFYPQRNLPAIDQIHTDDRFEEETEGFLVKVPRATTPTPEQAALRRERLRRLFVALNTLPPVLRRVAHLRYFEDYSGPDIAADLGLSKTTIPTYLATIRTKLRTQLGDFYHLPEPAGRSRGGYRRLNARRTDAP
jgi:RNA polymerase sigma factor (sigma-70 family)